MKKITVCIALAGLLALGGQAFAVIGTVDDVPAATLLLPYFEVDFDDPNGQTTLFSINNASAAPAIAHITLWTDLSIPTIDFNVYLTGYDVYTINLRDLFNGVTPPTESVNDGDDISPVGEFSLTSKALPFDASTCAAQLPLPNIPGTLLAKIRAAHTGNIFGSTCTGVNHGDNVARGYITVDNSNVCSLQFPGSTGYFIDGGNGAASNDNQLWGEYFYVNPGENFAQGETLVHIEADDTLGLPGEYTFYYRYSDGADNREGLASTFATRYATSFGPIPGGTDLIVWRDGELATVSPYTCGGPLPDPFPLSQNQIVVFDEEENPDIAPGNPFSGIPDPEGVEPFPLETQRVAVNGPDFPVPFEAGWMYLNLNTTLSDANDVQDELGRDPSIMQNWVTTVMDADNRFSVGMDAIQLDNVTFESNSSDLCLQEPPPAAVNCP